MDGKPPMFPGSSSRNQEFTPTLSEKQERREATVPGIRNFPATPEGNSNQQRNQLQNRRTSSRGSFLDDINDANYGVDNRQGSNNPINLRSLRTTVENYDPLGSNRKEHPQSSYRPMDANNPLNYHKDDNLRKLRNKVYTSHNYGPEENNPFAQIDVQEMNEDDETELDKIRKMEEELNRKKEEIQKSKMKLEKKQLYDLYEKETRLLDHLEEIKRQKEEEDQFNGRVRDQIVQIKLQQKKDQDEQKKIDRMLWNVERDNKMEDLVRRKLELERLQENTKYIDDISSRRKLELEEIGSEMKNRDLESAELLQKALNHADFIQDQIDSGAIDKEYQAKLVYALSGDKTDPENKQMREELLEELKAKILQQKEQKSMESQQFIQELNMKRMEFADAEKKINEQKLLHEAISRRGIDFLSELELGNAPPMEYVVKNLNIDEKQVNRKEPFSIKDIVESTKNGLIGNEQRLKQLKEDKEKSDSIMSKFEYKAEPIFVSESTQEVFDYIFDIIINKAWGEISMYDHYVDGLRKQSKTLKGREPVQEARIALYSDRISMREINNNILDTVIARMLREIANEASNINEMAKLTTLNIIVKAFKVQKGSEMDENTIAGILMNMQMQQVKEK